MWITEVNWTNWQSTMQDTSHKNKIYLGETTTVVSFILSYVERKFICKRDHVKLSNWGKCIDVIRGSTELQLS